MDMQQEPVAGDGLEGQKHTDQQMEVDDSMNTTITASTVGPLPDFNHSNNFQNNGYTSEPPHRPQTSYSDNTYPHYGHGGEGYGSRFNTPSDTDTPPRHGYYNGGKETQMGQSNSRPSSTMGRYPTSDGGARSVAYQEQNQRSSQPQEAATKNSSVVIKVGMVGDAQIGKTSLMVKYVEGSWDEDYIQTLGASVLGMICKHSLIS
jgi:Gtp-binding protein of the ras superfamily involved in termination of M-phase